MLGVLIDGGLDLPTGSRGGTMKQWWQISLSFSLARAPILMKIGSLPNCDTDHGAVDFLAVCGIFSPLQRLLKAPQIAFAAELLQLRTRNLTIRLNHDHHVKQYYELV